MTSARDIRAAARRTAVRAAALALAAAAASGCASGRAGRGGFDAGCLASADRDLDGARRVRAAGPFYERREDGRGNVFTALRPFYSRTTRATNDWELREYLWPVAFRRDDGVGRFWQIAVAYGHSSRRRATGLRYHCVVPPLFFIGRNRAGERHVALFPLGGRIDELFFQDRIEFILFPLYCRSRIKDVKTHDVLWPVFSWTRGPGIRRFRAFPLYGRSVNENHWVKQFALWPLFTSVRYDYPGYRGGGFILVPVVGRIRTPDQSTWMVAPPFFRWSTNRRGDRQLSCPWPFVQVARGPSLHKTYLWPLWGYKRMDDVRHAFFLWPIGAAERTQREAYILRRLRVWPLLYAESRRDMVPRAGTRPEDRALVDRLPRAGLEGEGVRAERLALLDEGAVTGREFKLWPLISYARERDRSRLQALALWPGRQLEPVERNWQPLWTLYSRTRSGAAREHELLWGLFRLRLDGEGGHRASLFPLFRTERSGDGDGTRRWSLLGGLAGYAREGWRREYRLLYCLRLRRTDRAREFMEQVPEDPETAAVSPAGSPAGL